VKGSDLSEKQIRAAEQYILLRRSQGNNQTPQPTQQVVLPWNALIMLVAEYGAIRAASMELGGKVDEPGEVYLTGKD